MFKAAFHQRQRECRDALLARLLALGDKAVRAVEKAIDAENPKVALEILRGLGLLRGKRLSLGSDDPATLAAAVSSVLTKPRDQSENRRAIGPDSVFNVGLRIAS